MPNDKETIEAKRRRPRGASAPSGRAEAPARRRPSTGSGAPPPPAGGGGYQPVGLPGGRKGGLSIGAILLLVLLFFAIRLFTGGGDAGTQQAEPPSGVQEELVEVTSQLPASPPAALPTSKPAQPRPTRIPSAPGGGDTWLVMLYQDADDEILEKDIYLDLNEAEQAGSSENVHIVAQIDRYRGAYQGSDDWVSTRRYYVTRDDDLLRVNSELLADLGEANMADGRTLVDFVVWAMQNYPADKYALILSDHGMGWPGGWSDPTGTTRDNSLPLGSRMGDQIYLHELEQALDQIRSQTGLEQFELLGMDACLMGHLEVLSALAPHARYAVTSQETEPSLGWAYTAFLEALAADPGMSGAELGQVIVDTYISGDQRIVNDQARADFSGAGNLLNTLFGGASVPSASQVTNELIPNVTLATIDLSLMPELLESFNDLAYSLQEANQRDVAQARTYAQSFTSIFGKGVPASYIDLGHFAQLAGRTTGKRSIGEATNLLLDVLGRAVIAERHGQRKPGATGISIYFPNSDLYSSPVTGMDSYTVAAETFASESLWDEYLAFLYSGHPFERGERQVTLPERGVTIESPAAGGVQVSALRASADSVEPGDSIRLTGEISGANIGYVRLLVGFLDQANRSLYVIDSDFLESPETRELNGVFYPDWGVEAFELAFTWEPVVFAIDDGATTAVALFTPETYGASAEEAVYSVEGIYTFASSGEQRYARLYFRDALLRQVFGFTGEDGTGAPREITPQRGDTFTILEKWTDLDAQGKVTEVVQQEGETLTFGEQMFTWTQLYAAAGEYIVGYIVEDLDGNSQASYVQVTVR
jgi:hypothetical protein